MRKIGFIGMGNMGYAMLKGLLNTFEKEDIGDTCVCCGKKADKYVVWGRQY